MYLPSDMRVLSDPQNNLWVRINDDKNGTVWLQIIKGKTLARVQFPTGFRLSPVNQSTFLGVWKDDDSAYAGYHRKTEN